MKLSNLAGKEIINLYDGARLGMIGESELLIDIESGKVESIIVPTNGTLINLFNRQKELIIPWRAIKKVGNEVIIVELEEAEENSRKYSF